MISKLPCAEAVYLQVTGSGDKRGELFMSGMRVFKGVRLAIFGYRIIGPEG